MRKAEKIMISKAEWLIKLCRGFKDGQNIAELLNDITKAAQELEEAIKKLRGEG